MSLHLSRIRPAVGLALGGPVGGPVGTASPLNTDFRGTAFKGYDVVTHFEDERSAMGSREHTYDWKGATWRSRSAEHRELFAAHPEKYALQYGGYCAYAVSQGATTDIIPGPENRRRKALLEPEQARPGALGAGHPRSHRQGG